MALLRGGLVRAGREVNLDVFADVDAGDAGVAHVFEGGLDGFALRIKHGFLGCDDDFGFHAKRRVVLPRKTRGMVAKPTVRREKILVRPERRTPIRAWL